MTRAFLAPSLLALLLVSCGHQDVPTVASPAQTNGLFVVTTQAEKQPTVSVENKSQTPLRLLLNRSDGTALTLDVPAFAERKITVDTGHYEAKVIDVTGKV